MRKIMNRLQAAAIVEKVARGFSSSDLTFAPKAIDAFHIAVEPSIRIEGSCLAPGEVITISYASAPHLWVDTKTGKIITEPEELAKCEEEAKLIRERETKLFNEGRL